MSRILITLDFPPEKGGIQRYLYDIARHEYKDEDMILVGCTSSDKSNDSFLKCKVKRVRTVFLSRFNKKFSLIAIFVNLLSLIFIKKKSKPEIECGNVYAAVPVFVISVFSPVKYSVYCHGKELLPLRRKGLKSLFLRQSLQNADKLHCNSTYTAQLLKLAGINKTSSLFPPKIYIPKEAFRESRDFYPFTHDKTVHLLSVGRLVEHKGHSVLLKAMKYLAPEFKYKLTIAGSGPLKNDLLELISSLNLSENVVIEDRLSDKLLKFEYQNSDIFILPSIESPKGIEGFGIVLLEAMLHRVPIIASRCGGIPEVLDNGRCGMLVDPGEPHLLADAIVKLCKHPENRRNFCETAFKRLCDCYAWK